MRTPTINAALEQTLSRERLSKYLHQANGNFDRAINLYEQNMRLSEAFYIPLQCLEICLRNKLHDELAASYGPDWYSNHAPGLHGVAERNITTAIKAAQAAKSAMTPGAVVAELSFGFWVTLLGPGYDATLWRRALARAFASYGKGLRRDRVHGRLNALRRFRNRVAHHEPIMDRDILAVHTELIEVIGWMCRDTAAWTTGQSRVLATFLALEP